jgi:hypothetical protein
MIWMMLERMFIIIPFLRCLEIGKLDWIVIVIVFDCVFVILRALGLKSHNSLTNPIFISFTRTYHHPSFIINHP